MLLIKPNIVGCAGIGPLDLINIKDILGCFYFLEANDIELRVERLEQDSVIHSRVLKVSEEINRVALVTDKDTYFRSNENIKVSFIINSVRYAFRSFISMSKKDHLVLFNIPASINFDDKRVQPRLDLPFSHDNYLELVTGIFSGVRIKGILKDISLGGLRFQPHSIENVRNSNEIDIRDTNISFGDKFRNLKFAIEKKILKLPGEIRHIPTDTIDTFGIKFSSTKGKHGNKLKEYIESFLPHKRIINFSSFYDSIKPLS